MPFINHNMRSYLFFLCVLLCVGCIGYHAKTNAHMPVDALLRSMLCIREETPLNPNEHETMHVVVSKYKEDTRWTESLRFPVFIYTKEDPSSRYNVPLNKGHEASAYFKYIIDHYDELPQHVAFVHGHESDWHHVDSMLRLNTIEMPCDGYINLNDGDKKTLIHYDERNDVIMNDYIDALLNPNAPRNTSKYDMQHWYKKYVQPRLGSLSQYELNYLDNWCAQFIVSRDRIRQHPKSFYETQYWFLLTTDIDNHYSARYYEWTWGLIFCYNDVRKTVLFG